MGGITHSAVLICKPQACWELFLLVDFFSNLFKYNLFPPTTNTRYFPCTTWFYENEQKVHLLDDGTQKAKCGEYWLSHTQACGALP